MLKKPPIYHEKQREKLRVAGRFNAQLMDHLREIIRPGITTGEIDRFVYEQTVGHGHRPATLGYRGYPKSCCTSVNDIVCHGIPSGDAVLRDGDIVNVDLTTIVNGWYGDQSETFMIGTPSPEARKLVQTTLEALWAGIHGIKPYGTVYDIGNAIYRFAKPRGYGVVQEYQGHGIGRAFHQPPGVPHVPQPEFRRQVIKPGMCFTIEPMLNTGTWKTVADAYDGWTVRTADGGLSAQFEHTVLMTEDGPEVLTLTEHGPQEGHVF
ncbi:MAG: type I methionyl aminopeptidase [Planctomycetaceae bacterium]